MSVSKVTKYPKILDSMGILTSMIIIAYAFVLLFKVSIAADSIGLSQSITIGNTLVSQGGTFELGFFTKSNKSYLGIWYRNIPIQKVVWVANRVNPINCSNATLTLNSTGNLVLSENGNVLWYTTPQKQAQNPVAVLLDTGNLVLRNAGESNPEDYLWQSFDYPSDTLLPGMKLGRNLRLGLDWKLTTWKSPEDPSPGDVSEGLVLNNYPEFYTMKGKEKFFRFGPWNGIEISGIPGAPSTSILDFNFVANNDEIYYSYGFNNNSVISILVLNQTSTVRYVWDDQDQNWRIYTIDPKDFCDTYGLCGAYGNCMITQLPVCQCLNGFTPKSPQAWISSDWSQGCVRNKPLTCNDTYTDDGFVKFGGLKIPDATYTWLNGSMGLEECRVKCLNNCSCMAYTNSNISGAGSGCVMWFGDLVDMRRFQEGGEYLYVRMSASELVNNEDRSKKITSSILAATIASICGVLLLCIYFIRRVRKKIAEGSRRHLNDLDLPLFDLSTIAVATNDFSMNKKIGEGGFGPVYKGKLLDGREIAVKRLSSLSRQGMTEFINEVKLIVKLQHRNLVKLLGCCIHGQELMLIYEYMANGSLDSFIFANTKGKVLEWPQRFHIICGIARGLVYLHQDSRLRIIHRDLKASNVLLDDNLNPKISDFGMAKTCGGDQTEGNTNRVVGTYGYMAPEYALDGLFSVKSDVFSFGILLLEVISGRRNRGYYYMDDNVNLVGHAWTLWKEHRHLDLIDTKIGNSCDVSEVLRCIHVSLLCLQQYPEDRPTMASVILMLGSEMELVEPKMPGTMSRNVSMETYARSCSTNEITITLLDAR